MKVSNGKRVSILQELRFGVSNVVGGTNIPTSGPEETSATSFHSATCEGVVGTNGDIVMDDMTVIVDKDPLLPTSFQRSNSNYPWRVKWRICCHRQQCSNVGYDS